MIPAYRPRYGFALWIGLTLLDLPLVAGRWEGGLSLLGFLLAFAWAQGGISLRPGETVDVGTDD